MARWRRRRGVSPARCVVPGIAREQRVVLLLLDTIDFPIAFWGAIRAGVVPVPINTLLTHEMVGYILADSRASALVISAPLVGPLLPVLHSVPELRRIIVSQPDGGDAAAIDDARQTGFGAFVGSGDADTADGDDAAGRGGVLAVFVGFDRCAEGRAPRARQSARDGRYLWRAGAGNRRRAT